MDIDGCFIENQHILQLSALTSFQVSWALAGMQPCGEQDIELPEKLMLWSCSHASRQEARKALLNQEVSNSSLHSLSPHYMKSTHIWVKPGKHGGGSYEWHKAFKPPPQLDHSLLQIQLKLPKLGLEEKVTGYLCSWPLGS